MGCQQEPVLLQRDLDKQHNGEKQQSAREFTHSAPQNTNLGKVLAGACSTTSVVPQVRMQQRPAARVLGASVVAQGAHCGACLSSFGIHAQLCAQQGAIAALQHTVVLKVCWPNGVGVLQAVHGEPGVAAHLLLRQVHRPVTSHSQPQATGGLQRNLGAVVDGGV